MNANVATSAPAGTAVARPKPSDFKPLQNLTIGELLEDPRVKKAVVDAMPRHLSPDRLLRVFAQAFRKTPKLAQCDPLSLLGAMISCASLGLEPNTPLGQCYLIPFEKRKKQGTQWVTERVDVNLVLGYQGLIDLCRRTGSLVSIHADVVYDGDEFSFEYGSNMHLRHVPQGAREGRKPLYAYAHSKLEDGEAFEVLPYEQVLSIRNAAQAYKQAMADKARAKQGDNRWATTPWIAYEHEMAAKTMVRRLVKWLPKGIELAAAAEMDALAERGRMNFGAIALDPSLASDPAAAQIEDGTDAEPQPQPDAPLAHKQAAAAKAEPAKQKAEKTPEQADELSEEEQREADRLSRAAAGDDAGNAAVDATEEWRPYLEKMLAEAKDCKTDADLKAVHDTVRDTIVGAVERGDITEADGDTILGQWAGLAPKALPKKGKPS